MISNKTNKALINEVLEDFAKQGINQLKESLERLFNQLMIAEREIAVGASPSNIEVEEYLAEEIQLIAPQKLLKNEVLRILTEASPNLKPSVRHVNIAIKKQVIELWSLIGKKAP